MAILDIQIYPISFENFHDCGVISHSLHYICDFI